MGKQYIISISRTYGSGGHYIAEKVAEAFGYPILDHTILDRIAEEKGINLEEFKHLDEAPRWFHLTKRVGGMTSSMEENLAEMQFEYIRDFATKGDSFVVVGRCGDEVLKDHEGLIKIFIRADKEKSIERVMKIRKLSREEATKTVARHDRNRANYHNYYSNSIWGEGKNYDMCINSSKMGLDNTANLIIDFINNIIES